MGVRAHLFEERDGSTVILFHALCRDGTDDYEVTSEQLPVRAWIVRVPDARPADGWHEYDEPVPVVLGGLQSVVYCVVDQRAGLWKFPECRPYFNEAEARAEGAKQAIEMERAEVEEMRQSAATARLEPTPPVTIRVWAG